jgi:hypothetical protein
VSSCDRPQIRPEALGFFGSFDVDVAGHDVPYGQAMVYSNATSSHRGIDDLAEAGCLYRGERERLHALLSDLAG